ncbi:hypothetical protein EGT74_03060 [Chitinophaga lutea]|uniref:Uncharacterized protein n=1 Tax=Chitinophaga lutea TaxID=2488634 RepID=A0A3N4PXA3_9BACT|nr:hypothetical protein [Chitinophaga lutea]RPE12548.1 hypothetical protein EGT74_03060 [Chitinophaga lutea]
MRLILPFILMAGCYGCGIFKPSAKYQFSDGYYNASGTGNMRKVYIHNDDDLIRAYPVSKVAARKHVDTMQARALVYGNVAPGSLSQSPVFTKGSFDIDFLTVPIKYRFPAEGVTRQLNANLNGGLYLGYRKDFYILRYNVSPIGISKRTITHLGFSVGTYMGFGNTFVSPHVTSGAVQSEYDGVVFNRGIAAIAALNQFTAGVAIGWDRLMDGNHGSWVYNNRPWLGLVFGLNLN